VPASTVAYSAQIKMNAGEIHFPVMDAEANPNGTIIERLNTPAEAVIIPDPFTIHFDDTNLPDRGESARHDR